MDTRRAQEIAASPIMANVTHDGSPVYIQNVDEQSQMARIYRLNNRDNEYEVHVNSLEEHNSLQ